MRGMKMKKMDAKRVRSFAVFLSVLALAGCSKKAEPTEAEPIGFSCYTLDARGEKIYGFEREEDGNWYLFVPSMQQISDIVLYYEGNVTEVSAGTNDEKADTVVGAFAKSGDKTELTTKDGSSYTVSVMQSSLPSLQIDLNGTDLETIQQDKDKKYKENTLILTNPDGSCVLSEENSVEIKGRGNTSWKLYDKKGYQVKFSEKTSVFDMGKAKKWILLANASDDSMIRTKLIYEMAEHLDMEFVPSFEYVDLWIDGEYLGTYMIGEKVENGSSRLDFENPTGALFEHDEAFFEEEENSIYNKVLQRHFVLKEIEEETDQNIELALLDFDTSLDDLMTYLCETPSSKVTLAELAEKIDVDSFVKYYLVNEYVQNREAFATSFFWYQDGPEDVLHVGPIWDFDTCMGNDGAAFTESYGDQHVLFRYLLAVPEFRARTEELYQQYQSAFAGMKDNAQVLKDQIYDSAVMNYLRWNVLGKPNPKEHARDFYPTFPDAVHGVQEWLAGRSEHFQIAECSVVTSTVSDDCKWMTTSFQDGKSYDSVRFVVLNTESDSNMVVWSTAEYVDGFWQAKTDLGAFNQAGMYRIDVYGDDGTMAITNGYHYVEQAVEKTYEIQAQLSDDGSVMTVTLNDRKPCKHILFAVWSAEDGQDDLNWFEPTRNPDGLWEFQIDMSQYHSKGDYYVHAYEDFEEFRLLDTITIPVSSAD